MQRTTRRRFLQLLFLGSGGAILAACSQPAKPSAPAQPAGTQPAGAKPAVAAPTAAAQPVPGGNLSVAYVAYVTHLDVQAVNLRALAELSYYAYETLFDRVAGGKVQPNLVKEEQLSPDGLTVTWKLQPNVKFHDGTPFNAKAVKWNLDRKVQKKLSLYDLIPFKSVDVVDDQTVKVSLTRPAASMNAVLASKMFSIYSPTWIEKEGDNAPKTKSVGTGPYTLEQYSPNDLIRFKKNPDYWRKGLPYLDQIDFKVMPDISSRTTALLSGDVDVALNPALPDVVRLKNTPGIKVMEGVTSQQYYITLNNARPPLNDVKVRQALNYAMDKEGIIKTILLGSAKVASAAYITSSSDGFAPGGIYQYDPNKAKQLLEDAGWKVGSDGIRVKDGKPLSLEMFTQKGAVPGDSDIAEALQSMLKAVGVDMKITVLESATFISRVTKPVGQADYDMLNMTANNPTGDAEYIMLTFYATSAWPPKYYNRCYYSNPQVDKLIEQGTHAPTREARDKIYADVYKLVFADAPILQEFDVFPQAAYKDTVHGIYMEVAANNFPVQFAWKEKK